MDIRNCPHCGAQQRFCPGDLPGTLTMCGRCKRYFLPAEEILKKPFSKTTAGERIRVAVEVAGVEDRGYQTVAHGYIHSFAGEGTVTFADGTYRVHGHEPEGDAWFVSRDGRLEWKKVED